MSEVSDAYLEIKIENKELTTSVVLNAHAHLGARYIMKEVTFFCDLVLLNIPMYTLGKNKVHNHPTHISR